MFILYQADRRHGRPIPWTDLKTLVLYAHGLYGPSDCVWMIPGTKELD